MFATHSDTQRCAPCTRKKVVTSYMFERTLLKDFVVFNVYNTT
jgi:hypothetical protein